MKKTRRHFIKKSSQLTLGMGLLGMNACTPSVAKKIASNEMKKPFFDISLAQWSLHRSFFNKDLDPLDFAAKAKKDFGISAIEYVNQFYKDKAEDMTYLKDLKQRADNEGVKSLLIMVDGEGNLGEVNDAERKKAVENHYKWVDAAHFLGCHSIRVNAFGVGTEEEVSTAAIDGLGSLATYAAKVGLNVIVENHGSYSSNGKWLGKVMRTVNMPNCGTLPDFGNFCLERDNGKLWGGNCINEYDRYQGVRELMPFAKAVSAKSHDFDKNGNEINTDFIKMMQLVKEADFKGYVGVEYEGDKLSEDEGILATKALLERVGQLL